MRGSQHLNAAFPSGAQHHAPEVLVDGVVKSVLGLVDQEEALSTVGERQGGTEEPYGTVTETLERHRACVALKFDDDSPSRP